MLFKIAPKDKKANPLPEMPVQATGIPDPAEGEAPGLPDAQPDESQLPSEDMGGDSPGQVDPSIVVYMTPDFGPFQCSNCVHFLAPNACHVVAGDIDPGGICHVFTPQGPQEPTSPEPPLDDPTQQGDQNV